MFVRTSRNDKTIPPLIQRWREDDYTWAGPKAWACFRPDADVLVPMYYSSPEAGILSPFAGERDISVLMRFAYEFGDGKNLVEHFGHRLRYELIEQWKADPLQRSEQGLATPEVCATLSLSLALERHPLGHSYISHFCNSMCKVVHCWGPTLIGKCMDCLRNIWQGHIDDAVGGALQETMADMARSVFCAAPPGQTQDSVRVFRAIIKGCIPVTFYRGNDRPFERHLRMPWDAFSVNMQPDDYDQLNRVLQGILDDPKRLQGLQNALAAVQRQFVWDSRAKDGVLVSIERELSLRASALPALGYS